MKIIQRKVWVTIFNCECGQSEEMWHHGEKNKPTNISYPSSGRWSGWNLKTEECPQCIYAKQGANNEKSTLQSNT